MSETRWFPDVVGHPAAKEALRGALGRGRLQGALLLVGPEGVGRGLLARRLAMAANCAALGDPAAPQIPCGACGPCHRIAKGVSGDLVLLRPEDKPSIGIEQVQAMLEELALAPVESRVRVFSIEPAGALTEPAQNALLKGLEEPPADALIVLVAEREEELLSTVCSRCRIVRLGELSAREVVGLLEAQGVPRAEAERRAAWSQGSAGQALAPDALEVAALAEQVMGALAGAGASAPLGLVEPLAAWVTGGKGGKADSHTQRVRLRRIVGLLQRTLRDALLMRATGAPPAERLSGAAPELLARLARLPSRQLEGATLRLDALAEEIDQNVNVKFLLDGLALDLARALGSG